MLVRLDQVNTPEPPCEMSAAAAPGLETLWPGAQALLDALPGQAALLDGKGHILAVNRAWREFGAQNAGPDGSTWIGYNYLGFCQNVPGLESLAGALTDITSGGSTGHVAAYDCSSPKEWRWYQVRVTPLSNLHPFKVLVTHDNVTPAIHALGDIWKDFSTLSPRERQVFSLVARGAPNKDIASELGVAEKTVETHRASVMVKMRVRTIADLVRRAVAIEVAMGQCELFGRNHLKLRLHQ